MHDLINQSQLWLAANGREFLLNVVAAVVVFVVGRWAAKLVRRVVVSLMRRARVEETLIGFGANIAYALIMAFVVIAALGQLGVQTASFVAIVGAAGLAVGLALQGSLANFAAGVLIILFRPFRVGDYIEAAGTSGTVNEIEIFQTRFTSPDNKVIIVPNAAITAGTITNYSALDTRRVDMVIGVHYDSDLATTKALLTEIVTSDERVLDEPAPVIVVGALADSSVNFLVRPWCKSSDYWGLLWDLNERIKNRLEEEGIVIPFPQMDLHVFREEQGTT
ncbi:MAG TPA: mechanosensitive ion channel domain-containing protein [Gammaproteobacteria bacterium]|nr:mechanosensitive ion channel domain-containing protein [Gammaproteobacteria bacterium]